MQTTRILTIGVYHWTAERFFGALVGAGVTTLVDVRRRRGVRGPLYSFANRTRLVARLAELRIRYAHALDLAPDREMLAAQHAIDRQGGGGVRGRRALSAEYEAQFAERILARFDPRAFLAGLGDHGGVVCLFCVEDAPEVCHRSLVAERIREVLGVPVTHLRPPRGPGPEDRAAATGP